MIMRTIYLRLVWVTLFSVLGLIANAAVAEEAGFKPIFDGKTLDGFKAPNMSYWSVKDGAITARSTKQNPVKTNQFLVWQLGELDDFELKLKYRISGTPAANSGIQIRSKTSTSLGDSDSLFANIKKDGWNEYHIIARSEHIILKLNGKVTAEVIDNDRTQRELSGVLALQLHSGPPMMVQFKDIQLKRLKVRGRKKIVLVARRLLTAGKIAEREYARYICDCLP
jgi:hypothetical protein